MFVLEVSSILVWGSIVKMRWSASGVEMMITDLKNGLFAHLPLHYLMNTRDESILHILFAKNAMGEALCDVNKGLGRNKRSLNGNRCILPGCQSGCVLSLELL